MQYYADMWTHYFDFTGRTSRRGYWMAVLVNYVVSLVISFVGGLVGIGWLGTVYTIAVAIPGVSISVRRLRDAGKHWGWYFINLIPLVGQIIFLVMLCQPSVAQPEPQKQWESDEYSY